jgi:transcriptional regulator with XRE-family HTH domain
MDISQRIKELRIEYGYTQEELAKKLGLNSKSSIANYEKKTNSPSDEIKLKMCEIFDCSMDYLLGKSNIRNPKTELDTDLLKIGLAMKEYQLPTEEQRKQIEEFTKYVLKDNKKK